MLSTNKVCPVCNKSNNPRFLNCWKCGHPFPGVIKGISPPMPADMGRPIHRVCLIVGILTVITGILSIGMVVPITISSPDAIEVPGIRGVLITYYFWQGIVILLLGILILFLNYLSLKKRR